MIVPHWNNKTKITYRELREKLSDMVKNVPKSQKSTEQTDSRKVVREGDQKHMYKSARTQIQRSHEILLKINDKMSPKKTKFR